MSDVGNGKAADHPKATAPASNHAAVLTSSNKAPPVPARPERRGEAAAISAASLIREAREKKKEEEDEEEEEEEGSDTVAPAPAPAPALMQRPSGSLLRHTGASVRSKQGSVQDVVSAKATGQQVKVVASASEERRGAVGRQDDRGVSTERAGGGAASEKQPSLEERRKIQRGVGAKGSREALMEALAPAKNAAALKAAEREVMAQAAVSSAAGGGAVAKKKKENRVRVGQAIIRALDSVQQHEKMLEDLASELDETQRQRDTSLLIEACILAPPLPPVCDKASWDGTYYPAWIVLSFMVHHGLVRVNAAPPAALASFSSRLSSSLVSVAERIDPISPYGLWAMSNSHLIGSMLKMYIVARKDASRSRAKTQGTGLELAIKGAEKAVQMLYTRWATVTHTCHVFT